MVAVAVKVTAVPVHTVVPGLAAMLTLTGKFGLTVMVMVFEDAGLPVGHETLELTVQYTLAPVVSVLVVYVGLLEPTPTPFTYH